MNRLQILMAMATAGTASMYAQDRPNVIFLIADDLGYGDLQCYGAKNVETPNADRVAAEGIRFTQCHATAATSTPSRYSILTGQYAWRKPGTGVLPGDAGLIIGDDQYTVADMFRDAGYATAAIGKWHLGLGTKAGQQNWNGKLDLTPSHIGFDYHYIQAATADRVPCVYLEQDTVANYDPSAPIQVSYSSNFEGEPTGVSARETLKLDWSHGHNQSIVDGISRIGYMKGGGAALWKDENIADSIADHSRRFIMEHKDEPFFMYLCTNDVHVPRWPHERFRGKNIMGLRGDAISSFDWTVGQVLQALEDAGVADNTLLIITSDNGPVLDDGYADEAYEKLNGHTPTAGRRGDKYSNFEGGTSVPFIVRWPNRIKPRAEENGTLLSLIDLYGSMGALIGAELPEGAAPDSGDMLAQILGESNEHRPWVSELGQRNTLSARTARWKYIPASGSNGALGWNATGHDGKTIDTGDRTVVQLFDMVNDPNETTNIAEQYPDVVKEMEKVWQDAADIVFEEPLMSNDTETHWYTLSTPLRDNRYVSVNTAGSLVGVGQGEGAFARSQWKFVRRADGTVNLINRLNGQYLDPSSAPSTSNQLKISETEPANGWQFDYAVKHGYVVIYSLNPTVQLNQTTSTNNYKVVNWGGARHDDTGCQFMCTEVLGEPIAEIAIPKSFCEPDPGTAENPTYYCFRSARYAGYISETANGLYGVETTCVTPDMTWQLIKRENGTVDFLNLQSGKYMVPVTVSDSNKQLTMSAEAPEEGWTLHRVSKNIFTIYCGTVQLNQTTSDNAYKIFNWGGGTNTTDTGCRFRFVDVTSIVNGDSGLSNIAAVAKAEGALYDLNGRRVLGSPRHGIYLRDGKKIIL